MKEKQNHGARRSVTIRPSFHSTVPAHSLTPAGRQTRTALTAMVCAVAMGACSSDSDGTSARIAQLSPATPGTLSGSCEELLTNFQQSSDTSLETSSEVPAGELTVAGQDIAAHCLVTGKMLERTSEVDGNSYAISFEMRLPLNWNGRFFHQGNGGIDGRVVTALGEIRHGLSNALNEGFAVLSSDAGHAGSLGPTFGHDPQARLDYGYQAAQKLTPVGKSLVATAYGKEADRSYFGGCSNGGRHVFNAFARMPDEYDGYLAGAPGFNLPKAAVANIFGAQRYAMVATDPADLSTAFTDTERATVASAVLASCDSLDGVADGIVNDVLACQAEFSLDDVPSCAGERDGTCLSDDQKTALAPIFSGATSSDGMPVYESFAFDPGLSADGIRGWEFTIPMERDSGAVGMIFGTPPEDADTFDGTAFVMNTPIEELVERINATTDLYTESGMEFATPPNPTSLSAIRDRGAKIMVYHGVSDPIFSALDTVSWMDGVQANHEDAAEFARLFLVPGMGHCGGGPATDQFDALTALVDWVEQGEAPEQLIASARGSSNAAGENEELPADWAGDRTRPLCPYPQVARYDGSGDIEQAASFRCE